jgi:class 3 adenylate cyclase/tetratricopeptide (TPR) repeat protein
MTIECHQCHHRNRAEASFCDECGCRLRGEEADSSRARLVELRHGTFAFCDLVGSTELANRLDLEDLRLVFRWFREQVAMVSRLHDGHLIRFIGDGAFLSFGLARASEDASEAAVRAGLALVTAISAREPLPGVSLALRVGIASGTVVVGDMIDEAVVKEESVVGSVPHLAARLAAAAPVNGVVIADLTRRAIGHYFECRDLGRLDLKGFEDGERAWLVVHETSVVSRFEARRSLDSPQELVGRAKPLAALNAAWALALEGRGSAVVISGEAGIGKSKLARTLRAQAQVGGATLVDVDCTPRTRNTPLYPVSVLMRRLAGIQPQDVEDERSRRAGEMLGRVLGTERVAPALRYLGPIFGLAATEEDAAAESADRIREHTIGLLVELVISMTNRGPLFVLCEDIHWADASTLLVVQRLCERIDTLPAVLIATLRSTPDAAQTEFANSSTVALDGLDPDSAAAIVGQMTHGEALPRARVTQIIERAEGIPLYLEELCRSELDAAGTRAHAGPNGVGARTVPQTLQAIIEARLDRWSSIKLIAQAASVIGRDFVLPLLSELLDDRRTDLPDAVARLVDAGLLIESIDERANHVRFRHALIHDAVYQTLLRAERQRLHARVAQLLVQHFDGLPESAPDVIAQHWVAAHNFDEAVNCLIAAGAQASERAAYLESASHSRSGLALLDHLTDPRARSHYQLQLLTQLGVALAATQGYTAPEVEATYRAARELCRDDADPVANFPIVRGLATFHFVRNEQHVADEMSTLCVEMAHHSGRPEFKIEALTVRGYTDMYLGRLDAAKTALEDCAALYRQHRGEQYRYPSVQDAGTAAWSVLGMIYWLRGDSIGAERSIETALDHAERRLARPFDRAYANCFIAQQLNVQRHHGRAMRHADVSIELGQRHGFNLWLVCGLMQKSIAAAALGPSAEAVNGLRQALGAYLSVGAQAAVPYFQWGLALGLRQLGDVAGANEAVVEGLRRADATGEVYLKAELLTLAAELEPSDARAVTLLTQARAIAERQGAVTLALRAALTQLRRRGLTSDDEQRDLAAWHALEARAHYPEANEWAQAALLGATHRLDEMEPASTAAR